MEIIKILRESLGMTQEQLAKQVGVTQGAVAQWENGLTHPAFDKLLTVASVLGVTVDELIGKKVG